ncbi:MAG: DNA polymerase III subunit gamma/tau [bacterium]
MSKTQETNTEQAIYRRYRPQEFNDVIGQDHIVNTLKSSLEKGQIGHAYLFCGSRGTGKTSVARILAKAVNCAPSDLSEIDAASHNSVDDIRELNEAVNTLPFESPYKVYIFDEVHMLSKGAFNALLKTLEEPPKHVIFILATTEMEKVPETIISRCQAFVFRKPGQKILKEMVMNIAKKEKITLEPASADLIALLGDGSFRDTQSILQKVISSSPDKKISAEEVMAVTGAPRAETINNYLLSIKNKDLKIGLKSIEDLSEHNIDPIIFIKMVILKLRAALLVKLVPSKENDLAEDFSEADMVFVKEMSADATGAISAKTLADLTLVADGLKGAVMPTLPLEIALMRIIGQN